MKAHTHITRSAAQQAPHALHALHTAINTSALYQYYPCSYQDSYADV